jgi:alpha-tubulin suppressor-like RCC1 family protein
VAYCWGANEIGQLGNYSHKASATPEKVGGGHLFRWVSPGADHTCGVTTDHRGFCWGRGSNGAIGNGGSGNHSSPVAVAGGLRFESIDAGSYHTCGLTSDARVYCWGSSYSGELGDGQTQFHVTLTPARVAGQQQWSQVSAGQFYTCGRTTGSRGFCWGTIVNQYTPTALAGNLLFAQIVAGDVTACGVTTDGKGYCWGDNHGGQLGNGTTSVTQSPVPSPVVPPL